jgi:hypothetical protein
VPTRQDVTCLHTAQGGEIWSVEAGGNPKKFLYLNNPLRLKTGMYRILGCPGNYKLITELYSSLNRREDKSTVLVGSPVICKGRKHTPEQVLSCISVLNVHDGLVHRWHRADSKLFNNYLLLHYFQEEGINDLVGNIYGHHCLTRYFSFMGLNSMKLAVQLINEVGDPRWYLNPKRPYRLSRLESYFGLKPAQFHRVWGDSQASALLGDAGQRSLLLLDIVKSLPTDGFVATEAEHVKDETARIILMCRLVLGFIMRNWLTEYGLGGYFDPKLFFKKKGNLADFQRQFKDQA